MPILANARHERFCQEIVSGKSVDAAYESAGYKPDRGNAARLTAKDAIRTRVDELLAAGSKHAEMTVERIVEELERIAQSDIRRLFTWRDGALTLTDSDKIDDATAACISEIAQTKDGIKIKLHSKLDAMDKLGRYRGMWPRADEGGGSVTNNFAIIAGLPSDAQRQLASLLELTAEPEAA